MLLLSLIFNDNLNFGSAFMDSTRRQTYKNTSFVPRLYTPPYLGMELKAAAD